MPCIDGLEMLQRIRRPGENAYSIVLTSHENFDYARTALKIGSAEYILKTEMTEEILRELLKKAEKHQAGLQRGAAQDRGHLMEECFIYKFPYFVKKVLAF